MTTSLPTIATVSRALHLVDIENMLAGWVTPDGCRAFLEAYLATGLLGAMDQVVVGVSKGSAAHTFPLPNGWRRALGPCGVDCADIALVRAVPHRARLRSFDTLVIASGDHFFCEVARDARDAGVRVVVVSQAGVGISAALYALADRHVTLPTSLSVRQVPQVAA